MASEDQANKQAMVNVEPAKVDGVWNSTLAAL
jgi:hypothetical protein